MKYRKKILIFNKTKKLNNCLNRMYRKKKINLKMLVKK